MSGGRIDTPAPSAGAVRASTWAAECSIAAMLWLGMKELAHWRLGVAGVTVAWLLWLGGSACGHASRRGRRGAWALMAAVEFLVPFFGWRLFSHFWPQPLRWAQAAYAFLLLSLVMALWRAGLARSRRLGHDPVWAPLRIVLLVGAALFVMRPYFSDRYIGGSDVRWYAFVLQDFLDQVHAGHFPVFLGQGPLAWSGAVHPFRSAPVYQNLAGLWDVLTLHALNVFALQHLTVITSAILGTLGFYVGGIALAPGRRWEIWLLALVYVWSAAWLGVLFRADAYMSFMAFAAMPLVLYGNARTLLVADGRSYGVLASGLALIWMCHPPIALLTSLVTVALQFGGFVLGESGRSRWQGMITGGLLFAGMTAYYFAGMSELPKLGEGSGRPAALQFGGLLLVLAGVGNAFLKRRGWHWLWLLLPGGAMLWISCPPWLWWMVATTALVSVGAAMGARLGLAVSGWAADIMLPALLLAAVLVQMCLGSSPPDVNLTNLHGLVDHAALITRFFPFVPAALFHPTVDVELGAGVWLVLALILFAVWRRKALALKLFLFVGLLLMACVVKVPVLSDFLVDYFPEYPARIISFPLDIRVYPVAASFVLMSGVVWLATAGVSHRRAQAIGLVLLGAIAGFSFLQAAQFDAYGPRFTSSLEFTQRPFRPENRVLDRFAYDLLPMPLYFSNGSIDPRLEFRLLDAHGTSYTGPDLLAREMEAAGSRRFRVDAVQNPLGRSWLELSPTLAVVPDEQLLLRFEFNPARVYLGVLILRSEHGYREYQLPNDGNDFGFGTREGNSHVLALTNTGPHTEFYHLSVATAGPQFAQAGFFGSLIVSEDNPARHRVRIEAWDPLRVVVSADRPGWLETPRSYLPGYRAMRDGEKVPVASSSQHLVMVPLTPGQHTIELRYCGTPRLWLAGLVSVATWVGWLAGRWRRWAV